MVRSKADQRYLAASNVRIGSQPDADPGGTPYSPSQVPAGPAHFDHRPILLETGSGPRRRPDAANDPAVVEKRGTVTRDSHQDSHR